MSKSPYAKRDYTHWKIAEAEYELHCAKKQIPMFEGVKEWRIKDCEKTLKRLQKKLKKIEAEIKEFEELRGLR